jgi:altronate dehydratase small subunit
VQKQAILININDNVATTVTNLKKGSTVNFFAEQQIKSITLNSDLPFGHKFAIKDIPPGENIIKYGESIGTATTLIKCGEHVHVHNMVSNRGRGDLNK